MTFANGGYVLVDFGADWKAKADEANRLAEENLAFGLERTDECYELLHEVKVLDAENVELRRRNAYLTQAADDALARARHAEAQLKRITARLVAPEWRAAS